jgi:hypothetical protein
MSRLALFPALLALASCTDDVDLGSRTGAGATLDGGVVVLPGGARLSHFASTGAGIHELAMDDTDLYWVEDGSFAGASLRRVPRAGGAIETLHVEPNRVYALALDSTDVYITQTTGEVGRIVRVPKNGDPAVVVATPFNPLAIALDDDHVYYTEGVSPAGSIWRVAKAGGAPELVADDVDGPYDLAVDGDHVYCTEMNRGRIVRYVKSGGAPEVLADGWVGTVELAIDDHDVYFSACSSGPCETVGIYIVGKSGGPTDLLSEVTLNVEGKIALSGDAVVWGNWWQLVGGDFEQVRAARQSNSDPTSLMGVAASPGQAFLGDFYTGEIYELGWDDDPL